MFWSRLVRDNLQQASESNTRKCLKVNSFSSLLASLSRPPVNFWQVARRSGECETSARLRLARPQACQHDTRNMADRQRAK